MCGISGICSLSGDRPIDLEAVKRMCAVQTYRGPDESGIYIDDHTCLGQVRLSIIDLNSGTQPISNEDETLWIVYNGEVYNYPELRKDLIKRGHQFSTRSDTEVILHLYEDEGKSCLNKLNGQFAFAIWDSADKKLFLARDRVGIRPLHYAVKDNLLYFSSEVKGLFAAGLEREIDVTSLNQVFSLWTTVPGRSVFRDISELKPGHYLKASEGKIRTEKYYELPYFKREDRFKKPVEEISEELRELLTDATDIRLRADVNVGSYLSGGLDSSGLSSIAKNIKTDLRTFGIRFEEHSFDEGSHQRGTAEALGVEHSEITASNQKIAEAYKTVVFHTEKPLLRTAPVPLFLLSGLVREEGIKVVLTGEGADELFGGYNIFRETLAREFISRDTESKTRVKLLYRLYPHIFKTRSSKTAAASFFMQDIENTHDPLYSHRLRWKNTSRIRAFFSDQVKGAVSGSKPDELVAEILPEDFKERDLLSKAQYLEQTIFLSNYLLSSQGDRVAMANSLEIRLPYLDYRVMEFASRIPDIWKIRGLNEKYILKKAFRKLLPDSVIRRDKQPYRAPIHTTFASDSRPQYIDDMMSKDYLEKTGLFNAKKVSMLWKKAVDQKSRSEVEGMALAGILSAQLLYYHFIDKFTSYLSTDGLRIDRLVDRRSVS